MSDGPYIDPRFKFAAERTMLAWVRTGLALMGFGFIMVEFSSSYQNRLNGYAVEFGTAFIFLGILIVGISERKYRISIEKIVRDQTVLDRKWSLNRLLCWGIVFIGLSMILLLYVN